MPAGRAIEPMPGQVPTRNDPSLPGHLGMGTGIRPPRSCSSLSNEAEASKLPRTPSDRGMAQVAHGCATTRVRTGRPVEGCALPPGHGGPVRSWHYRREYRPVRRSPVTGLLAVRPGVPGHAAWASCSDTGAPGPRPAFRGHGFCAGTPPWARDAAVRFEGGLQPMVWRFPPAAGAPARGLKDAVRVATAPRAGLTPTSVAPARRPGVPAAGG